MAAQPKVLQLPSERLSELQAVKKNQQKYGEWKEEFRKTNKSYRVIKSGFKSGVLSVDNPY